MDGGSRYKDQFWAVLTVDRLTSAGFSPPHIYPCVRKVRTEYALRHSASLCRCTGGMIGSLSMTGLNLFDSSKDWKLFIILSHLSYTG